MTDLDAKFGRLVELLERHSPSNGPNYSCIEGTGTFKESLPHAKNPIFFDPIILVVGRGRKYCYVGDQTYEYSAGALLALLIPMPVETELIEASPENPFLAACIGLELNRMADVLLKIEQAEGPLPKPDKIDPSGIFAAPLQDRLLDSVIRLFEALENPVDALVLGTSIIDEIYYRILRDERSGHLRILLQQRGQMQRISRAVEHIHEHLDKPISVEALAGMVHMSRTRFHESFRAVMHVSPLQYAKAVKLHRAQGLIKGGKTASEAGYLVGYNSPAQFSREYKRHFGYVPSAT